MNTEHCSLTRSPSTSQFLLIWYDMEEVYFHMKPMLPSFKWYISTYQTLSVLLRYPSQMPLASGHNKSEDVVCDGIHYCNLPIAYWPGLVSVFPSPSPASICTSYFSFIMKAYVLSMLTNMFKSESCLIHWVVQVSCLRLESFNHKFHPWTCTTACWKGHTQ